MAFSEQLKQKYIIEFLSWLNDFNDRSEYEFART